MCAQLQLLHAAREHIKRIQPTALTCLRIQFALRVIQNPRNGEPMHCARILVAIVLADIPAADATMGTCDVHAGQAESEYIIQIWWECSL